MNTHWTRRAAASLLVSAAIVPVAGVANAQQFPSRAITIVVPFTAGGGSDIVTRVVGQKLGEVLGTNVIVDNRPGAGGTIGSALVARASADGHTLISLTTSTHAIAPSLYSKPPYDPVSDFEAVGLVGTAPYVLAIPATSKAADLKSFVAEVKTPGTQWSFASAGVGTLAHLVGEQFCKDAGISCQHVPYQGESASFTDLMSGAVAFSFFNPIGLVQHVQSGKLKAIAQTAKSPMLPNVPTFVELGMPAFNHELWLGLAAPKGTPAQVVKRLNEALQKVLADPAIVADLNSKGFTAKSSTDSAFKAQIAQQRDYWAKVVKDANVKIQ